MKAFIERTSIKNVLVSHGLLSRIYNGRVLATDCVAPSGAITERDVTDYNRDQLFDFLGYDHDEDS